MSYMHISYIYISYIHILCITWAAMDIFTATPINKCVDAGARALGKSYFECARTGRQILDLTFPLSLVIEKAGDLAGLGAIAQGDIVQFYDHIRPLHFFEWLQLHACLSWLRLQCLPIVAIRVGDIEVQIAGRCIGLLTGTRGAVAAGRIPTLDIAQRTLHTWRDLAFRPPGISMCLASFVDNLFATGHDALSATAIIDDCAVHLQEHWELEISDSSREVLPADMDLCEGLHERWQIRDSMKCLGHILSGNGTVAVDWHHAAHKVWSGYFANAGPGLAKSTTKAKTRFLQGSLLPILSFKWSRWPFTSTLAKSIDSLQHRLVSHLFPILPHAYENVAAFALRRSRRACCISRACGEWSEKWANSLLSWQGHVQRGNDPINWSSDIIAWRGPLWLQEQRFRLSTGGAMNRTGTRLSRGPPPKRWQAGLEEAKAYAHLRGQRANRESVAELV